MRVGLRMPLVVPQLPAPTWLVWLRTLPVGCWSQPVWPIETSDLASTVPALPVVPVIVQAFPAASSLFMQPFPRTGSSNFTSTFARQAESAGVPSLIALLSQPRRPFWRFVTHLNWPAAHAFAVVGAGFT